MMKKKELSVKQGNSWSRYYSNDDAYEKALVNDSKILKEAKNKKRKYIDGLGDELIELVIIEEDNDFYYWSISKFNINNNRLTQDELEIIKEQYLDVNDRMIVHFMIH
jgi:hypothetical protein